MFRNKKNAITLLEVVISIMIFAFVTMGFVASLIASSRASETALMEVQAENVASRIIEEMQLRTHLSIEKYDMLGDADAEEADSFLTQSTYYSDPDYPEKSREFNVQVQFKGFGRVDYAGDKSLRADIPDGFPEWNEDQWEGSMVMIKKGKGSGQIARIVSNTTDELTITRDLTGSSSQGWITRPDSSSTFEINGGKTAIVTVSWTFNDRNYEKQFKTLVYHP